MLKTCSHCGIVPQDHICPYRKYKNDFENSLAKLQEYLNTEEFKREEENYAKIFTPILLTRLDQDYDKETQTFSSEKFLYKFSTDELKEEIYSLAKEPLDNAMRIKDKLEKYAKIDEVKEDTINYFSEKYSDSEDLEIQARISEITSENNVGRKRSL